MVDGAMFARGTKKGGGGCKNNLCSDEIREGVGKIEERENQAKDKGGGKRGIQYNKNVTIDLWLLRTAF
jgi:hypothetical protein